MSLPTSSGPSGLSKTAIPKLQPKRPASPRKAAVSRLHRINRACLSCRARKIKCNGAKPTCANCRESTTSCVYASSRKDRLRTATGQNHDMIELLRDLREQVSVYGLSRIDDMLASVVEDVADASASLQKGSSKNDETEAEQQEDPDVHIEAQSPANLDSSEGEHAGLMQNKQIFTAPSIAQSLETQQSQRPQTHHTSEKDGLNEARRKSNSATTELRTDSGRQKPPAPSTMRTPDTASFFLNDKTVQMNLDVDPFELPSFDEAECLLENYMASCHNSFPFLAKKAFTQQFYRYYAALTRGQPYEPAQKWQTQLNLVFAISALYTDYISLQRDDRKHLIYHSRACALSSKDPWWSARPNLAQMQIMGLLSFYYLCAGHINRSWTLSGMALRFGCALGLHDQTQDSNVGPARKEVLARVWWSHHSLETLLATMTGWPSLGSGRTSSVPLPLPLSSSQIEDTIIESRFGHLMSRSIGPHTRTVSSLVVTGLERHQQTGSSLPSSNLVPANSGSYLRSIVQLSEIRQKALDLYTSSLSYESWQQVGEAIVRLTEELDLWVESLPDEFNFIKPATFTRSSHIRERNMLDILYHGTIILVTRPCLCRLNRRISTPPAMLSEFNQRSALTCVASAKAVARLLPDGPNFDIVKLYEAGPWWIMVHTIMQCLIVLLLEISYEAIQLPHDRREIIDSMKKLVRWLQVLRATNEVATRASCLVIQLLRELVLTVKMDVADIFQEDEQANMAAVTAATAARVSAPHFASNATSPYGQIYHSMDMDNSQSQGQLLYAQNKQPGILRLQPGLANSTPYAGPYLETTTNSEHVYMDLFSGMWDKSSSTFPVSFFTKFDEQNPLPGFG